MWPAHAVALDVHSAVFVNTGDLPGVNEHRASIDLVNGTFHDIVLEYWEKDGGASIQVCRC